MGSKGVESILSELEEFEEILTLKGLSPEENVVRKSFRVPVDEDTPVRVTIGGSALSVANVSEGGIGLTDERADRFSPGDKLTDVQVHYGERSIQAGAVIRHATPLEEGGVLYGLALEFQSEEDRLFVEDFVQKARERFFAKQ